MVAKRPDLSAEPQKHTTNDSSFHRNGLLDTFPHRLQWLNKLDFELELQRALRAHVKRMRLLPNCTSCTARVLNRHEFEVECIENTKHCAATDV